MGKDRTIKLIANLIGKSTAHKILIKHQKSEIFVA